jgi:murein DD-endopeptidase MepM/ murein hydrolase activator NlpD
LGGGVITGIVVTWLHLLAFAAGLAGVWARARALDDSLRHPEDPRAIRRALVGGAWWWIALVLWLATGAWELVSAARHGTSTYAASAAFTVKISLFVIVLALEIWPATTLARWWRGRAEVDARNVGRIEVLSYVQCALVALIALASIAETRGAPPAAGAVASSAGTVALDSAATLRDSAPPRETPAADEVAPPAPTGTEAVTPADVELLTGEIAMPLDGIDPTALHSSFADARGGGTRTHQALDIMAPRGTPIHSAAAGRVLKLFTSRDGGLMVYAADPSERWVLMYAHLDRYAPGLTDGTRLARGQVIGFVGSTGNASPNAPHLHFAIARSADVTHWSRGKPIDPLPILVAARARR